MSSFSDDDNTNYDAYFEADNDAEYDDAGGRVNNSTFLRKQPSLK